MRALPSISNDSVRLPHCCLTLSLEALTAIRSHLPSKPCKTLSIGCGSGLLEALLNENSNLHVEGVEVSDNVNKFLPRDAIHTVKGTWQVFPQAQDFITWMFVYPRSPDLISKYISDISIIPSKILWIGPVQDWDVFVACFPTPHLTTEDPIWLSPFEVLRVINTSN